MSIMIFLLLLISTANANWLFKEDKACNPPGSNTLFSYSGFRIHRQYSYGIPLLHHVRLTHCDSGSVDMEAVIPTSRNTDMEWGVNICVKSHLCYRAVRLKRYSTRLMSLYVPYTMVGGLFICPPSDPCTNNNALPVLPLLADRISQQWLEFPGLTRITQRVPYFYTPSLLDPRYPRRNDRGAEWARHIDVNENYTFTDHEKYKLSMATSEILNTVHNFLTLSASSLPWQIDLAELDLAVDHIDPTSAHSADVLNSLVLPLIQYLPADNVTSLLAALQRPLDSLQLTEQAIFHPSTAEPVGLVERTGFYRT